jgi:acetyltransferase-like isoleucine patch superfamily enzyme
MTNLLVGLREPFTSLYTVHPLADVNTTCIGEGTKIWQFCVVLRGAKIGKNCNINAGVLIEDDVKIGDNVTVKSGVQLWNGIIIEDNVFIGPNVTFTNDLLPRSKKYPQAFLKTMVKKGASLGANSTIIANHTIGEYAIIGAGSVITKNIPPYTIWYGNPAKQHGFVTQSGILLDDDLCDECGKKHDLTE